MTLSFNDGDGTQALDAGQLLDRYQFATVSGCGVSINSGTLGQADTLTLAAGEVIFNGSTVSVASQSVQIDAANAADPRKDVVYLDSTGTAQVANGTPEATVPSTETRFETFRPAPLDLSATDAVVVAEVWVPAGASSITSSDLRDRRVLADAAFGSLEAGQVLSNEVNRVHYASNNDAALPGFQTAVNNAAAGDTVVLSPGLHDISTTQTVDKTLSLVFYGALNKTADVDGLVISANCGIHAAGARGAYTSIVRADGVANTTAGIVYHSRVTVTGTATVTDCGGHGHYVHQAAAGDSFIGSTGVFEAIGCGGDGFRVENTTTNASDLNAYDIGVHARNCSGTGVNLIDGFGNRLATYVEGCGTAYNIGADASKSYIWQIWSEGNTSGGSFDSAADNIFFSGAGQDFPSAPGDYQLVEANGGTGAYEFVQTTAPTASSQEIMLWEDSDAAAPAGRIVVNINGTQYVFYADE